MVKKILVVDDEKDIVELIAWNAQREGFAVLKAFDGEAALQEAKKGKPDLVVLDLMLPGMPGLDVCRALRTNAATARLPIIMLTAKGDPLDKIIGLESGADDYIAKPFHVRELVARIRAVLRRTERQPDDEEEEVFVFRGLRVDYRAQEVSVEGVPVPLSPTEIRLLKFLSRHAGRAFSRDQLLDAIWRDEAFVEPRTVDVNVSRLRSAIEPDKENPRYILTVRGIGYKFCEIRQDGPQ
jgi:phosphate regulon transcriptional regulator PhoB